jgi:hypothetical protein
MATEIKGQVSVPTRYCIGILGQLVGNKVGLVNTGIAQYLDGAGSVAPDGLKDLETRLHVLWCRSYEGNAESHSILNALGATLALVYQLSALLRWGEDK